MRIKAIVYDKVTVTCRSDPKKGGAYTEATVSIREGSKGLEVMERKSMGRCQSALYAEAALVELTPCSAKFTACWWSSRALKNGKWKHLKLVPVEVTCEL